MFNIDFLRDTFERGFSTFCQGFVGAMAVPGPDWTDSLKIGAVAAVIAQRAHERGQTPKEVCLKPYQFSCWNGKSLKSLEHLLKVPQAKYAIALAKNIKLLSRDFVGFANHYHATWMKKKPYWAKGKKPVKVIGQHAFYKL